MSQRRGSDDGSTPGGDGDLPELPPEWGNLVIPDDPRELAVEAAQVRAELEFEANKLRWQRLLLPRRLQRYGLSGPLIALMLMLVAAISSLVIVVTPTNRPVPRPAPQATPTGHVGTVGGLLPDLVLRDDHSRPVTVRGIRPAVLLLMPTGCGCGDLAADLVTASRESMVSVELIGTDHAPVVATDTVAVRTRSLVDPRETLAAAVLGPPMIGPVATSSPPTATAVLVRSDGVITRIVEDLRSVEDVRADIADLTIR